MKSLVVCFWSGVNDKQMNDTSPTHATNIQARHMVVQV